MNEKLKEKLLVNGLQDILHRKDYDEVEKALMIDELAKERGCNVADLAKELNTSKKELYRIKKILDSPEEVLELVNQGQISGTMASKIMYNLKDEEQAPEVAEYIVKKKLNQVEAESYIARVNEPKIVNNQIHSMLIKFNAKLMGFLEADIKPGRQDDIKEQLITLRANLVDLQDRVGIITPVFSLQVDKDRT